MRPLHRHLGRRRMARDVEEEIEAHFEGTVELLVARGMDESEARAEVRRRFGDRERYRRELVRMARRRMTRRRTMAWWDAVRSGVGFALRSVARAPGFAAAVVATLALGIGANAAMFEVVDRLVLSPPPGIDEPDELRRLWVRRPDPSRGTLESQSFAWQGYRDLMGLASLEGVAAWAPGERLTLGDGSEARRIDVNQVSGSWFDLLGARPSQGRLIGPGDDRADAPPVAVLAHDFWTSAFGADPGVLGEVLHIGAGRYEVVGVAPPGFTGVEPTPVDVFLPVLPSGRAENGDGWISNRQWWWLRAVARIRPEGSLEAVEAELTSAHRGGYAEVPGYEPRAEIFTAPLLSARGPEPDREARVAVWLAGVSLLVLLIACANVANLFLARAERRRRELAVRVALGIGRGRLLTELLAEALLLTALGAAAAMALAHWGGSLLQGVLAPDLAVAPTAVGGRLLVFTGAAAVTAVLLSGLIPALRAAGVSALGALGSHHGTATRSSTRLRGGLVAFQTALSAVLLVGAGLFVRSLDEARGVDLGYDAERIAVLRFERGEEPTESSADLYRMAEEALPRIPSVASAARIVAVPMTSSFMLSVHVPELDSVPNHPESGQPRIDAVGAGYFETMGIELVRGRGIHEADVAEDAEPVAVVTRAMEEHVWGSEGALGRCVRVGGTGADCSRIVGVAENVTWDELHEPPLMMVWVAQGGESVRGVSALAVRLDGDPEQALPALRSEITSLSPSIRYVEIDRLSEPLAGLLRSWRLGAAVLSAFGVLAWLVAGIGLYSLLAFEVAQRHRELGIRKALGAPGSLMMAWVTLHGLRLVALGLGVGLGAAWLAGGLVDPLLFEVSARTPGVYILAVGALLGVALLAIVLPARRAVRADPMETLRTE